MRRPLVPSTSRRLPGVLAAALALGCGQAPAQAAPTGASGAPLEITLDATDAPRRVLHAHLVIPAHPGPLTLQYPRWIPGEHAPTGPILGLSGLRMTAKGEAVAWRRDDERIYEFHVDVPRGASAVEVDLDYLEPAKSGPFSAGASATASLTELAWNHVVLYPKGVLPASLPCVARLRLPAGWKYGTALPVASQAGEGVVEFRPASLETLVDSPVVAGAHFRAIPVGDQGGAPHVIDLVADSDEALAMTAQQVAAYKQLVAEAGALFGAHHYRDYHFLYSLSDAVTSFGLEHHESSDDRVGERTLIDEDARRYEAGLLPHEFVHSWNGKYRRPRGLATRDFQEPMRGDLLWIYEGLTEYLGWVLTGRSGLLSQEEELEDVASYAATLDQEPGRAWRPLEDTAVAAQVLYEAPAAWRSDRRGVDFYSEGLLVWLEVDATIRTKTQGRKSLDDFCRAFHGGVSSGPEVKPYDLDDVVRALDAVAPNDWRGFFDARVRRTAVHAPLGGIELGGYRLVFDDQPNAREVVWGKVNKATKAAYYSLGLSLDEDGQVIDAVAGMPAARAGVTPDMRVVAIDGRTFSTDRLHDALVRAKAGASVDLIVSSGDFFQTLSMKVPSGERHPHLERDRAKSDLLAQILAPRTPRPPEAVIAPPKNDRGGP